MVQIIIQQYFLKYKKHWRFRLPSLIALLILIFSPSDGWGISTCLFHHFFGIDCPACGLTRSMSSLLHFEFFRGFGYHPLGFIVLALLLIFLITNDPGFVPSKANQGTRFLKFIFSLKFLLFLFVTIWIFRLTL
jgi:hypothetical protein